MTFSDTSNHTANQRSIGDLTVTTSSVSTLSTALSTLQTSVGTNSSALASKADTSSIYTQQHINDNFQTVAPSGKSYAFDTDLVNFLTASDISGKQDVAPSGETYAYVSQISSSSGLSLNSQGRLGINTSSPICPLHVESSDETDNSGYYRRMRYNTTQNYSFGLDDEETSIYARYYIISAQGFIATQNLVSSDERIKKEIVDVEDGSALETLRLLKPKKYKYVDEIQRGSAPVLGFIAQEVRDTLPYATQTRTECLPNIYELANVSDNNVITFANFDTSNLESNALVLKVFDKYDKEHLINIAEVVDEHSVRVDVDLSEWTEDDKIFVYGQQVDDFVFLKKDAIWTVATSALQEVDRKVTALEARISALEKN